nr:lipoate-protein ligase A [Cryptococcus depauperatus CBS 7855]
MHIRFCPRFASTTVKRFSTSSRCLQFKQAQPQTPAADHIQLEAPASYISESHDPWFNLSYEDWLLRNTPHNQPVLFLYRNSPCVVIGRNQNPWKETSPRFLREESIPLVRRRSGGGTVYHDMGNTNFSIILPRLLFTRSHGAQLVARAVRSKLGISGCSVNERNDIVIKDGEREYKMSRFVHVGTLQGILTLFWGFTSLDQLTRLSSTGLIIMGQCLYHHLSQSLANLSSPALQAPFPKMKTKGVASHRSPVTTLNHHLPLSSKPIHHEDFVHAILNEFSQVYSSPNTPMKTHTVIKENIKENEVWKGYQELMEWEWQYGQTPEFSNNIEGNFSWGDLSVSLTSRHAVLTSLTFHLSPPLHSNPTTTAERQAFLDSLALSLIGKRYESLQEVEGAMGYEWDDEHWRDMGNQVLHWLRRSM